MMCGSWDMEHDRQFFVILDYFLPFYPKQPQKLWKIKKNSWKYYHFTYVYHEWQPYDVWLLWYREWQTEFFNILDHFLPFHLPPPTNNTKNKHFEKLKNTPEDIITFHKSTKNHDHMLHCSWDMAGNGCNCIFNFGLFFSFLPL